MSVSVRNVSGVHRASLWIHLTFESRNWLKRAQCICNENTRSYTRTDFLDRSFQNHFRWGIAAKNMVEWPIPCASNHLSHSRFQHYPPLFSSVGGAQISGGMTFLATRSVNAHGMWRGSVTSQWVSEGRLGVRAQTRRRRAGTQNEGSVR